jgi:phosphoglycerate-specific signal transduction histidine kinase
VLSAHLWDLRSQAEAKLRFLTRLQQQLSELDSAPTQTDRIEKHQQILNDMTDIVTISKTLQEVARAALQEAMRLS